MWLECCGCMIGKKADHHTRVRCVVTNAVHDKAERCQSGTYYAALEIFDAPRSGPSAATELFDLNLFSGHVAK